MISLFNAMDPFSFSILVMTAIHASAVAIVLLLFLLVVLYPYLRNLERIVRGWITPTVDGSVDESVRDANAIIVVYNVKTSPLSTLLAYLKRSETQERNARTLETMSLGHQVLSTLRSAERSMKSPYLHGHPPYAVMDKNSVTLLGAYVMEKNNWIKEEK